MPRTRPPYPAVSGLWGQPTIIDNVETLATLPAIIGGGAEWYAAHGTEASKGTKTFALVGKVRRTGLIEVPFGTTLRTVIYDIGGGLTKDFKAVQTGGPSGGCLSEEFLDTPIEYENLAAAGSIMGSGGLIVLDRDTCIVDTARYFLSFTQSESCGKCVPCRVGTGHLVGILDAICEGRGELADLERLERLARVIKASSLCGLGQTAPNPVLVVAEVLPRRVRRAHRRQALPGGGLPRSGRLPRPARPLHRLRALRRGLPDRRHHRSALRAPQPRPREVHQVPLVLRGLPLRRHRRRRHRDRIEGAA